MSGSLCTRGIYRTAPIPQSILMLESHNCPPFPLSSMHAVEDIEAVSLALTWPASGLSCLWQWKQWWAWRPLYGPPARQRMQEPPPVCKRGKVALVGAQHGATRRRPGHSMARQGTGWGAIFRNAGQDGPPPPESGPRQQRQGPLRTLAAQHQAAGLPKLRRLECETTHTVAFDFLAAQAHCSRCMQLHRAAAAPLAPIHPLQPPIARILCWHNGGSRPG